MHFVTRFRRACAADLKLMYLLIWTHLLMLIQKLMCLLILTHLLMLNYKRLLTRPDADVLADSELVDAGL